MLFESIDDIRHSARGAPVRYNPVTDAVENVAFILLPKELRQKAGELVSSLYSGPGIFGRF